MGQGRGGNAVGMTPFALQVPPRIVFGRGEAAKAVALIRAFGDQGVVVHGATPMRAAWLVDALRDTGCTVTPIACAQEPTLAMLQAAIAMIFPSLAASNRPWAQEPRGQTGRVSQDIC